MESKYNKCSIGKHYWRLGEGSQGKLLGGGETYASSQKHGRMEARGQTLNPSQAFFLLHRLVPKGRVD